MAKLTDFTGDTEVEKATNSKLGLVKGGADVFINENGEMEIMNSYGGSFRVSVSGTTATIGEGRITMVSTRSTQLFLVLLLHSKSRRIR